MWSGRRHGGLDRPDLTGRHDRDKYNSELHSLSYLQDRHSYIDDSRHDTHMHSRVDRFRDNRDLGDHSFDHETRNYDYERDREYERGILNKSHDSEWQESRDMYPRDRRADTVIDPPRHYDDVLTRDEGRTVHVDRDPWRDETTERHQRYDSRDIELNRNLGNPEMDSRYNEQESRRNFDKHVDDRVQGFFDDRHQTVNDQYDSVLTKHPARGAENKPARSRGENHYLSNREGQAGVRQRGGNVKQYRGGIWHTPDRANKADNRKRDSLKPGRHGLSHDNRNTDRTATTNTGSYSKSKQAVRGDAHPRSSQEKQEHKSRHLEKYPSGSRRDHSGAPKMDDRENSRRNTDRSFGRNSESNSTKKNDGQNKAKKSGSSDHKSRERSQGDEKRAKGENDTRKDRNYKDDNKFKKPLSSKQSRSNSGLRNDPDHSLVHYHEDDILSIMADDDGFDREPKRVSDSSSLTKRKSSRDRENKTDDIPYLEIHAEASSSIFGDTDSNLFRHSDSSRHKHDNNWKVPHDDRQKRCHSDEGRKKDHLDTNLTKHDSSKQSSRLSAPHNSSLRQSSKGTGKYNERREKKTFDIGRSRAVGHSGIKSVSKYSAANAASKRAQVFASKIKRRTLQSFKRNDVNKVSKFDDKSIGMSRDKSYTKDRQRVSSSIGMNVRGDMQKRSSNDRSSSANRDKDKTMFKDHRTRDTKVGRVQETNMSGQNRADSLGRLRTSQSRAVLKDDRQEGLKRMGLGGRFDRRFSDQSRFSGKESSVRHRYSTGKQHTFANKSKSVFDRRDKARALSKGEHIKKRYQRVADRLRNKQREEIETEREMERQLRQDDERDNLREMEEEQRRELDDDQTHLPDNRRVVVHEDDLQNNPESIDTPQPIYFIPNADMAVPQQQYADAMGNLIIGSQIGVQPGEVPLQYITAPEDPVGPREQQQQLIFIPFSQMQGLPDNVPPLSEPDVKDPKDSEKEAKDKDKGNLAKLQIKKKPLSQEARIQIKRKLNMKRRLALERKIEEKILNKLMKNPTFAAKTKVSTTGPIKRRPLIKRISPPTDSRPSHAAKKLKLIRRPKPEQIELDDVSDEYENVSEYEEVSETEDISDDEVEEYGYEEMQFGSGQQKKRPVFRKPGQPRVRKQLSEHNEGGGDVRRVVDHTAFEHRIGSQKRHLQMSVSENKTSVIKKRHSISPIEITVRNDNISTKRLALSGTLLGMKSKGKQSNDSEERFHTSTRHAETDEETRATAANMRSYERSNSGGRQEEIYSSRSMEKLRVQEKEGQGKYGSQGHSERKSDGSHIVKSRREEQSRDRRQIEDRSRSDRRHHSRSPGYSNQGNRSPKNRNRDRRSGSPKRERHVERSEGYTIRTSAGNSRRKTDGSNSSGHHDYKKPDKSSQSRSQTSSSLHSSSKSAHSQQQFMVYSSPKSYVDHSLPPHQQFPPISSTVVSPLLQNVPDMSVPPPLAPNTVSQVVVQQPTMQCFQQSNFQQQQYQSTAQQFQQQQPILQAQNLQPLQVVQQPVNPVQQQSMVPGQQVIQQPGQIQSMPGGIGVMQQNMNQSRFQQGRQFSNGQKLVQGQGNFQSSQQNFMGNTQQQSARGNIGNIPSGNMSGSQGTGTRSHRNASISQTKSSTITSKQGFGQNDEISRQRGRGRQDRVFDYQHGHQSSKTGYHGNRGVSRTSVDEDELPELLCSKCDKIFLSGAAMRKHKEWHDKCMIGDKDKRCDLCEQAFTSGVQNEIHYQEKHCLDAWSCNLCDRTFSNPDDLETHFELTPHPTTKFLYNCSLCPASFMSLMFLYQHKKDHHSSGVSGSSW